MQINYEELDLKAQPGAFSTFDAEVLVPEIMKLDSGDIYVEVGVDKGKSLSIINMIAKEGVRIIGVDINHYDEFKEYLKNNKRVEFILGDSYYVGRNFNQGEVSVLFIDGDHSYEGCKRDIEGWYPKMKKDGVMLFHDCDESSPGVQQAVAEFVNNHTVKEYNIFKRVDKNTSMALIRL